VEAALPVIKDDFRLEEEEDEEVVVERSFVGHLVSML
jgi:hypothetical protein